MSCMVFTTSPVQPTSTADEMPSAMTNDEICMSRCMFSVVSDGGSRSRR